MARKTREYKVGAFVLAGMIAIGGVIFLIGEERQLFKKRVQFETSFHDVQGLTVGSTVRMGGLDVGRVTYVGYASDAGDRKIHVTLSVLSDQAARIKRDSVATIEGKGLLGDKMLSLSIGTENALALPIGSVIQAHEGEDFAGMLGKFAALPAKVEKVVDNLERTTKALSDERLTDDVKGVASSLNGILGSLDRREGYVGRVMSDPAEAQRLSKMVANLERATGELSQTVAGVNQVIAQVRTGPGLVHQVLYGGESEKAIAQFGGAAEELRLTLKGIREGNGVARGIIYGDDQSQALMQNLASVSQDLKQIVADVRAGKGTLGALLVDPSVYEDLKLVLGNVERNKALRALVRYSIRRDDRSAPVQDPAGESAGAEGQAGAVSGGIAAESRSPSP